MMRSKRDLKESRAGSDRAKPQQSEDTHSLVPSNERRGRKVRASFYLSAEILDELRNVVVALSGPPDRLTLSDLAEGALRRELERLKRVHRRGNDFPKRMQQLHGGRPIK